MADHESAGFASALTIDSLRARHQTTLYMRWDSHSITHWPVRMTGHTSKMLEGYSGADTRRISEKACDIPFIESVRTGEERNVEERDMLGAVQSVEPSVAGRAVAGFERLALAGGA